MKRIFVEPKFKPYCYSLQLIWMEFLFHMFIYSALNFYPSFICINFLRNGVYPWNQNFKCLKCHLWQKAYLRLMAQRLDFNLDGFQFISLQQSFFLGYQACLSHRLLSDFFPVCFWNLITDYPTAPEDSPPILTLRTPPIRSPRRIPPINHTRIEKTSRRKSISKKCGIPARTKIYTLAEIQLATNSFSEENLLGEGSLGSVYKAEFPNGQVQLTLNHIFSHLTITSKLNISRRLFDWFFFGSDFGCEEHQYGGTFFQWRRTIYGCDLDCFPFEAPKYCNAYWLLYRTWTASSCVRVC